MSVSNGHEVTIEWIEQRISECLKIAANRADRRQHAEKNFFEGKADAFKDVKRLIQKGFR